MKLFINFYLVFSILISTTFSNILMAKMFESSNLKTICSYSGDKILLPNGKLIDENKFHEECDICTNCFPDFSLDLINSGKVSFTIDQQQRLQGYMPVIVLHLYNNSAGLLPGANIPSGPGFVDKSNASSVAALAGVDR